jgi:hypothetical protein
VMMMVMMTTPMASTPTAMISPMMIATRSTGHIGKGLSIELYTILQITDRNISHVCLQVRS